MRVIFLDVDGVLNSHRTVLAYGGCSHPHNYADQPERIDQTAVRLLRGLCRTADLKVVLSSTWRIGMTPETMAQFAEFLGLPIIDATPTDWRPQHRRGHEIKAWLDNHAEVTHYAIVDDDCDMLPEQMPQFVQTHHEDGLTWAPFQKLCRIFGVMEFDCGAPHEGNGLAGAKEPNKQGD